MLTEDLVKHTPIRKTEAYANLLGKETLFQFYFRMPLIVLAARLL